MPIYRPLLWVGPVSVENPGINIEKFFVHFDPISCSPDESHACALQERELHGRGGASLPSRSPPALPPATSALPPMGRTLQDAGSGRQFGSSSGDDEYEGGTTESENELATRQLRVEQLRAQLRAAFAALPPDLQLVARICCLRNGAFFFAKDALKFSLNSCF